MTLIASSITDASPSATIAQVAFYVQINGINTLLGYGTQTSPGLWTLSFKSSDLNLAPGTNTLLAQAQDNYGIFGDMATLDFQVL